MLFVVFVGGWVVLFLSIVFYYIPSLWHFLIMLTFYHLLIFCCKILSIECPALSTFCTFFPSGLGYLCLVVLFHRGKYILYIYILNPHLI